MSYLGTMKQSETIVNLFKKAALVPGLSSAWILQSGALPGKSVTVISRWAQRNLERGKMVKFQQYHLFDSATAKATDMLPVDVSNETISRISNSDELRASLRDYPSNGSGNKQYLEIWKHHQLYQNYDLSALDVHGEVYTDEEFSSLEWSPCETKVIYIAERKVPKSEPFYKPKPQDSKENDPEKAPQKGEEYTYRDEWGETLVGKHQPVVVVCDLNSELLTVLDAIPSEYSPGQVIWTPDGKGIVGVGWKNEPRRLGLVYCTNRESVIFHLSLENGEFSILSQSNSQAVRSPRFSPDGQYLVWLQGEAGGPHHAGLKLMCCLWETRKVSTVIDLVKSQIKIVNGKLFNGIYSLKLPHRCWSTDSNRLFFSTPQRFRVISYVVDISNGEITELEWPVDGPTKGSGTILDVSQDMIVMSRSSLRVPAGLVLGNLPPAGQEHTIKWMPITSWVAPSDLQNCEVQYISLLAENSSDSVRNFNALYVGPHGKPDGSVPLIVYPHGGPHSMFTDEYSLNVRLMVTLGYGVLLVNFRGSIGLGEDSVHFLPGRVGDADVKDVHQAKNFALKEFSCLNPKKCVLFGGSHGGFLVTHLSGQYPNDYCAVVARNPVVDIASMTSISDIPDWCYTEAGYLYNPASIASIESLAAMRQCSPIQHIANVKAPTLLMLGKKDLRVPFSQGMAFYHTLHANGVITKVHVYDDVHGLGTVPVEMDNIINSMLWFGEHTG